MNTIGINGGNQAIGLQKLQARQAFKPLPKPENNTLEIEPAEAVATPMVNKMDRQLREIVTPIFTEVNEMAQQLGYVGLTQSQVAKAYTTGDSLLADYSA